MRSLHRLQTDIYVSFQQRKAPQEYAARLGRSESRARTCVQPVNEPVALPLSYFRAESRMRLSTLIVKSHSRSLHLERSHADRDKRELRRFRRSGEPPDSLKTSRPS